MLKLVEMCRGLDPRYKTAVEKRKEAEVRQEEEKKRRREEEKRKREEELLSKMATCVTEVGVCGRGVRRRR